jgi:alpha-tubulin suppressor-like RCC1 family protein
MTKTWSLSLTIAFTDNSLSELAYVKDQYGVRKIGEDGRIAGNISSIRALFRTLGFILYNGKQNNNIKSFVYRYQYVGTDGLEICIAGTSNNLDDILIHDSANCDIIDPDHLTVRRDLFESFLFDSGLNTSAYLRDGVLWTWGDNTSGKLGDGSTSNRSSPVSVLGNHSFILVACGRFVGTAGSLAGLKADGSVWTWGINAGILGDNTTNNRSSPVSVVGDHSFTSITRANGTGNTYGLKVDGTIWNWGTNSTGHIGDNSVATRSSPVSVVGNHSFIKVFSNISNAFGLKEDGSLWAWGSNASGQLGINSTTNRSSPTSVVGGHRFVEVLVNSANIYALKKNGNIWAWGRNEVGQLGDGSTSGRSSPISVAGGFSFRSILNVNSVITMYALRADASLWACGSNVSGQLGDGTTVSRSSPISVIGNISFTRIAGSSGAINGLGDDGTIWSWGQNTEGYLADNSTTDRSSPISTIGDHSFIDVFVTSAEIRAFKADGSLWGWGRGASGRIGDNAAANRSSPVSVINSVVINHLS